MVAKHKQSDLRYDDDTRLALLEQSIGHLDSALRRFEHRFDQLDQKIEKVDMRIDSNFKWLLSIILAGFGSLLGIIAHAQHWI